MDIEQLVASVTAKGSPKKCWATRLDPDAKAFVDACTQVEADGGFIDRTAFMERLSEQFDLEVGYAVIRHHLSGHCSCRR